MNLIGTGGWLWLVPVLALQMRNINCVCVCVCVCACAHGKKLKKIGTAVTVKKRNNFILICLTVFILSFAKKR